MIPFASMKPVAHFLTPSEAAEILGVSRPGFLKMVQRGEIGAELTTARQRFFALSAVNKLKRDRDKKQAKRTNGKQS